MNNANVSIRQAKSSDVESLIALLQVLFSIEEDFLFDAGKQWSGLRQMLDNRNACVLVAEAGGQVVGMCTGQLLISTAEGGPALLVEDVVVREDCRGMGTGRLLMEEITGWGEEQGVTRLQLLADCTNLSALDFYRKTGWQETKLICLRKLVQPDKSGK